VANFKIFRDESDTIPEFKLSGQLDLLGVL
jgi:hypothetical protein